MKLLEMTKKSPNELKKLEEEFNVVNHAIPPYFTNIQFLLLYYIAFTKKKRIL